jgi:hypothetical protein
LTTDTLNSAVTWTCSNEISLLNFDTSTGLESYNLNEQTIPIINSAKTIDKKNCLNGQEINEQIFVMNLGTSGIIGSYEEDADDIYRLIPAEQTSRKRRQTTDVIGKFNSKFERT